MFPSRKCIHTVFEYYVFLEGSYLDSEHEDGRIIKNVGLNQELMYGEGSLIVDFALPVLIFQILLPSRVRETL
jgi:hypothetical protein